MRFSLIIAFLVFPTIAFGQELVVGTFNTESASDTSVFNVSKTIRKSGFVDVWALQEVEDLDALTEYTVAAGSAGNRKSFRRIMSESGEISSQHRKSDYIGLIYNSSRLRHVETVELHGIRSVPGLGRLGDPDWKLRGALIARFQDRGTGAEFYVGNVHLKCCSGDGVLIRAHQAELLKQWVQRSDVPVILTGDFNIPVAPSSTSGAPGSAAFSTLTSAMEWLRPSNPIKTQCSPNFNSMLDHFFLKEGPNIDVIDIEIRETLPIYCADEQNGGADHRPVIGRFSLS